MPDADPVESSPTPPPADSGVSLDTALAAAVQADDLAAYKAAKFKANVSAASLPTPAPVEETAPLVADSAPAEATPAASPAEPPKEPHTPRKKKEGAEERVSELLAERAQLRADRERLERELTALRAPKAPETPAPVAAAGSADDPEPQLEQYAKEADPYGAHLRAHVRWELRNEAKAEQAQKAERERTETQAKFWHEQAAMGRAAYPDFDAVAFGPTTPIPPGSLIEGWIHQSPVASHLLYRLHSQPAEVARILAMTPRGQMAALRDLERTFEQPDAVTPVASVAPVPPPPEALDRHVTTAVDPVTAAVRNQDFQAYKAARLQQRSAGRVR